VVADGLELVAAVGLRPQRLAHRLVADQLVLAHLGDALPRAAHPARQQVPGHPEPAVAHQAQPQLVALVDDLDAHVPGLGDPPAGLALPAGLPGLDGSEGLGRRRLDLEAVRVLDHTPKYDTGVRSGTGKRELPLARGPGAAERNATAERKG